MSQKLHNSLRGVFVAVLGTLVGLGCKTGSQSRYKAETIYVDCYDSGERLYSNVVKSFIRNDGWLIVTEFGKHTERRVVFTSGAACRVYIDDRPVSEDVKKRAEKR